jgi:hypothetical protein
VGRDDDIRAIIDRARQTRRPLPRWLWLAAAVVVVISLVAAVSILRGDTAAVQRRDHSSRSMP